MVSENIESALSIFDLKAYGQTEVGKVGSALSVVPFQRVIKVEDCLNIESALSAFDFYLSAVPFDRVTKVEDWYSIESALSAFPFERVIQVQVCLSIETALSAFDFEGGCQGSGGY